MKKHLVNNNIFYNIDCIKGSKKYLEDNSIDLFITDPPYGINGDQLHKHYNRDESHVVKGYVEIPLEEYNEFSKNWIKEAERVLKPGGSIYIVSGYTNLFHILDALRQTKLEEVNHIIWKYNFGVYTSKKFISSHYHILFYKKPPSSKRSFNLQCRYGIDEKDNNSRSLNYSDREDVWIINREYKPGKKKNKNELPYELLKKIIQYSSNPGDLVCDFFMGGFSTGIVSIGLNRNFVGFEVSENIFDLKVKEIKDFEPGFLIDSLRKPKVNHNSKRGQKWSDEEISTLLKRYAKLRIDENKPKNKSVEILCKEFNRGKWAIERQLNKHKSFFPQ